MDISTLLDVLHIAEKLKDTTRHADTSGGRRESVAEHTFRTALMAYFMKDEFPEADIDKVIKMCLIHDLGEALTGDIPAFEKTASDEETEKRLLFQWLEKLPAPYHDELRNLYAEMDARQTPEARLFKALDGLEAVIQHNEADLSTWAENEYELNLTYAEDRCSFSPYLSKLRERLKIESIQKINSGHRKERPPMKVVALCGSMRFFEEMQEIAYELETKRGYCAITPVGGTCMPPDKEALAKAHYRRIDLADAVYIVNIGGYIGESVQEELRYAKQNHKEIIFHEA